MRACVRACRSEETFLTRQVGLLAEYLVRHGGTASMVDGWTATREWRKGELIATAGQYDVYFFAPTAEGRNNERPSSRRFRSKKEVARHFGLVNQEAAAQQQPLLSPQQAATEPPHPAASSVPSLGVADAPVPPYTVAQLRAFLAARGIDTSGCIEKVDTRTACERRSPCTADVGHQ